MKPVGAISLSWVDLSVAGALVLALAALSFFMQLGLQRRILIAGTRTLVQLLIIGLILKALFAFVHLGWVTLMALVMLGVAGREVMARQSRPFQGWWGYATGTSSMFMSSFSVLVLALVVIVGPDPWYEPQYAIPLLGMLLGNTMNGVALSIDRLTQLAWSRRPEIEQRLMLGQTPAEASRELRRDAMRTAMIPIINSMAAAGIISLPGMMTGQILAGAPPTEAVKYQILVMFLISSGTGFGVITAIWLTSRRLFDDRARLRLDRLRQKARAD